MAAETKQVIDNDLLDTWVAAVSAKDIEAV